MSTMTATQALAVLDEALSAMDYTSATISPWNCRERKGDWVEVHAGRAFSSHRQLQRSADEIREARAYFADLAEERDAIMNALEKIRDRCAKHPDDTLEDCRRNLYHAHSIAAMTVSRYEPKETSE